MDKSAIDRHVLTNFVDLGVQPESIGFANVTMQSENFVCIRESRQSARSAVKILDLRKGVEVSEKPVSADSIIMNPKNSHMALRALGAIQVFDLDTKAKVASFAVDFEIIFWTWINDSTIAMVASDFVYKWSYVQDSESMPEVWFEKSESLDECQIINIQSDRAVHWCLLTGIQLKNGRITGTIQLYNHDKKLSQIIEGHAGCFFQVSSELDAEPYSLLAFATRTASELKVQIAEIDHPEDLPVFNKRVIDLPLSGITDNDFPISIIFDSSSATLLVYTKFGHLFIVEPYSAKCILSEKCSDSPLYLICPSQNRSLHFVLNRKGELVKCTASVKSLVKVCLSKGTNYIPSASQVAEKLSVEDQKEVYRDHFNELKNSGKHLEALQLIAKAGKSFLRSFEYMTMIKEFPQVNNTNALLEYFALILQEGRLNEAESIELAQLALKKNKLELLKKWSADGKIHFSSQLGTLILEADTKLALEVFLSLEDHQNAALACCLLDQYNDQFKALLDSIDLASLFEQLRGNHKEPAFKLISFLFEEAPSSLLSAGLIKLLIESDLDSFNADVDQLLAKNPLLITSVSSSLLDSVLNRLVKSHPEMLLDFLNSHSTEKLKETDSLYETLVEKKQYSTAFCLVNEKEAALELLGKDPSIIDVDYKYLKLSSTIILDLITHLLQQDDKKLHQFCTVLGKFADESSFVSLKAALKEKLSDSEILSFLTFWSSKIKSDEIAFELLASNMKLKQFEQVDKLCREIEFSEPLAAFEFLKNLDYKCNGLVILADRFDLEAKMIAVFAEKEDQTDMAHFIKVIGVDAFYSLLAELISSGLDESFLTPHLKQAPSQKQILLKTAQELQILGRLEILSATLESCQWKDDEEVLLLKAKLLCLQARFDEFCQFLIEHKKIEAGALSFAEEHFPKAAVQYYQSQGLTEQFISLTIKLEEWDSLSKVLIDQKNKQLWLKSLREPYSSNLFQSTLSNCIHFSDPESASVLVKVLIELDQTEQLIQFTAALLKENPKFKSSRSLQTLHLIHLIPQGDTPRIEKAIDDLDAYSIEEVIRAAVIAQKPDLVLRMLEKFELWPAAFKTAFFVLENIQKSLQIAEKWNNEEAFIAIFQYYLQTENAQACLQYSSKLPRADFKAKELVQLLKQKSLHNDLYDYLVRLRDKSLLVGPLERVMFDCLVALDRMSELEEFVSSASPANAVNLGFALARGQKYALAGEAFIRASDYDRAVKCWLHTENRQKVFDCAMKSKNSDIWIKVCKLALKQRRYEVAHKLAIKCLESNPQLAQTIFTTYNGFGSFEELIEVLQVFVSLSASPNRDILIALGSMYAGHQPSSLDAFLTKFHSLLPVTFVNVLAEHGLWKESFNFFILAADIDRALQVVIGHPSVTLDCNKVAAMLPRIKDSTLISKLASFYCEFDAEKLFQLKTEFLSRLGVDEMSKLLNERQVLFIIEDEIKRAPGMTAAAIDMFIDSNDYYGLVEVVKRPTSSVDLVALSAQLAQSPHRHFRVLGGKLAASGGNHRAALKILLKEEAMVECLLVLAQTGNLAFCEAFFVRFARGNNAIMFMAILYVLFDSIRLDVMFEWSQRGSFQQLVLPLICQQLRNRFK